MAPAQVSPEVVRFGVFEADLRAGELRRNGAKVRIQDLPFSDGFAICAQNHGIQLLPFSRGRQSIF